MHPTILATSTALPTEVTPQSVAYEHFARVLPDDRTRRKARMIFDHAGVDTRHFSRPRAEYLDLKGFGDRNRRFQQDALALAIRAARSALEQPGVDRSRVKYLILSTTTGLATPSLDAPLALAVELPPSVQRIPLFGLGCASGAASLARAAALLRGDPEALALVVAVELCGLCFDPRDDTQLGMVAAGLFGDGAAAVVMAGARVPRPAALLPTVLDSETRLLSGTEHIMGWSFEDEGFRLVLDRELPHVVEKNIAAPIHDLLSRNDVQLSDVRFKIFHPGGPRVIEAVERGLGLPVGSAATSRSVMAAVGNLSSASVLFVLDRVRTHDEPSAGDHALLIAPGPGFSVESSLLKFQRTTLAPP